MPPRTPPNEPVAIAPRSSPLPWVPPRADRGRKADPDARYRLDALGPAVAAAETERAELALEVVVRWGEDILETHHVEPPRAFPLDHLGSEIVIDPAALVLPITLSLDALTAAYRTPQRGEGAGRVPVTLDVAAVRAGRRFDCDTVPYDARRVLAGFIGGALTVAAILGGSAWSAWAETVDPNRVPPGETSREELLLMTRLLHATAEREREEQGDDDVDSQGAERLTPSWARRSRARWSYLETEGEFGEFHAREPWPAVGLGSTWPCAHAPFGFRRPDGGPIDAGLAWCGEVAPGWDCSDFSSCGRGSGQWANNDQTPAAPAPAPPSPGRVALGSPTFGADPSTAGLSQYDLPGIERVARQTLGMLRECYREGHLREPDLAGLFSVKVRIGPDGEVASATNAGPLGNWLVVPCVLHVFEQLEFPPRPRGRVITVVFPVALSSKRPGISAR